MPTGYTHQILNGEVKTFSEFAMTCSRAFGATVHMRDEPTNKKYTPREPSEHHKEAFNNAKSTLAELRKGEDGKYSGGKLLITEQKRLDDDKKRLKLRIREIEKGAIKLKDILSQVKQWIPPTDEHDGIKKFMIQQLESTLEYDGDADYEKKELNKVEDGLNCIDARVIHNRMRKDAERELKYHGEEYRKEVNRCNESNLWIQQLIDSI